MTQGTLTFEQRRILSVTQITRAIKGALEREWNGVWVRGEIGNVRVPGSGHWYFVVKDDAASLKVVLFRNAAARLKFRLSEGQEVLVRGRVSVFEPKGEYQLVADIVEPVGAGALQLAFEELKKRLEAEGLFDSARKRPLPFLPRRIGIVTSASGAALRDILAVLSRRAPNVSILLSPVKVQGDGASPEIANAIRRMDAKGEVDVMIVGRGGGSLEDLWPFNEEPVARALFHCKTPTISAVGHEIDFTIADFVADRRAATPSAAAEIAAPDVRDLKARVAESVRRLASGEARRLARLRNGVADLGRRLKDPRRVLEDKRLAVDDWIERAAGALKRRIAAYKTELVATRRSLAGHGPAARLAHARTRLDRAGGGLRAGWDKRLALRRARLAEISGRLEAISPLAVLGRGYALVRDEAGHLVKNAADTRDGQRLRVTLASGEISVVVASPSPKSGSS